MVQTIREVLTRPDPELYPRYEFGGPNSFNQSWHAVTEWQPWRDFTSENLESMFKDILSTPWENPPTTDHGSDMNREIRSEKELDVKLGELQWPLINRALERTGNAFNWGESFNLKVGASCHGEGPPDWGLASDQRISGYKYFNLLPGDTKLTGKWNPAMELSSDPGEWHQWTLPVRQILTYAADTGCRYGFIITEDNFVALRISSEPIGQGLAASRPVRSVPQTFHQRVASGNTDLSSLGDTMSLDSFGGQSYLDNNPRNVEYHPPEYAVVRRNTRGRGEFTIKLGVFCLCLMARGETYVDHDYPPLDRWRWNDEYHLFYHITSGLTAKRLPKGALEAPTRSNTGDDQHEEDVVERAPDEAPQLGPNILHPQNPPTSDIQFISIHDVEIISSADKITLKNGRSYYIYYKEDSKKDILIPEEREWTNAVIHDGEDSFEAFILSVAGRTFCTRSLPKKGKAVKRKK